MDNIIMNRKVIKEVFISGPQKLMGKGLKYLSIENVGDFIFGNGKVLGFFYSDFEQYTDYAFGGRKLLNKYRFYLEDGTPLTNDYYEDWTLEDIGTVREEYLNEFSGFDQVLLAKDAEDEEWYFLLPSGKRVHESKIWEQ